MKNMIAVEKSLSLVYKSFTLGGILAVLLILTAVVYPSTSETGVSLILASVLGFFYLAFILWRPHLATFSFLFIVVTNLAVIAYKFHHVPMVVAGSTFFLILFHFIFEIIIQRRPVIIDYPFLLMLLFLGILFLSFLVAKDQRIASDWILTFIVEGLIVYFLIINVIRNYALLRKAIWVLILAGGLLGSLSFYQDLTGSYANQFGGLALRNLDHDNIKDGGDHKNALLRDRKKVRGIHRAKGPIGEKNYYAQAMLMLLPLAFFRFRDEKTKLLKGAAGLCFFFILCGLLLTYSRGAFLILCFLLLLMALMRIVRPHQFAITLLVIFIGILIVAPGFFGRMSTIKGVSTLVSPKQSRDSYYSIRGRATEMLAAWKVFRDHPILGVGPGQYSPFYSKEYMSKDDIAFKRITTTRRSHNLYLELAAETGIFGLFTFLAIALLIAWRLWHARRMLVASRPELANISAAFLMAILSYLGTGLFLSFSYQRYYWMMIALTGATIQILSTEPGTGIDRSEEKAQLHHN
jgi:hypothetical protein